ncbi:two-component system sensor histidine kinase CreC [Thalassolituus sp. LLYu03]|uniref:two-component system sensor histidine kinase CreC n=1 Tax=Thalassolituus sp. LLYu03 TaxID=3421656 RepID=UPI003D286CA1
MSLSQRIFIAYIVFVALCSYAILHIIREEIKPAVSQATEENLVDTANLLAEFLRQPLLENRLRSVDILSILNAYGQRNPAAKIGDVQKSAVYNRVYVTDAAGIVLLDSDGRATGEDYSRWNDVYLTLRGQYGARSSSDDNPAFSVMYVAAPIRNGDELIGVVSVGKSTSTLKPYVDYIRQRLTGLTLAVLLAGLLGGGLFSWWLSRELRRLREYAINVSQNQKAVLPRSPSHELRQLGEALESMREQLDGKAYIERYVQTLTHELKSPITGIRAAAELLQSPMPDSTRTKFLTHIENDSQRLLQLTEKLLQLSQLEQQQVLREDQAIDDQQLLNDVCAAYSARLMQKNIRLIRKTPGLQLHGDYFLLRQALSNLFDNALDFTPQQGEIHLSTEVDAGGQNIHLFNQGPAIDQFALPRLSERFYSLPRPDSGKKSSGLGLSLVQEVMALHHGQLIICNAAGGVRATLHWPA